MNKKKEERHERQKLSNTTITFSLKYVGNLEILTWKSANNGQEEERFPWWPHTGWKGSLLQ